MRFVLDTLKFSQNFILVWNIATVDAHGVFFIGIPIVPFCYLY